MEACQTPRGAPAGDLPDSEQRRDDQAQDRAVEHGKVVSELSCSTVSGVSNHGGCYPGAEENSDFLSDMDDSGLLRSFDMVYQFHQRSEEIRKRLDKIDGILLSSRSTSDLVEKLLSVLRTEMNLTSPRIVLRQGHPIASVAGLVESGSVAAVADELFEDERFDRTEPFILDCPSDPLGTSLFGDDWSRICSAVVARLCTESQNLGALCLGGEDPNRYHTDMNTELVASLAEKVALGLINAWDHETSASRAIFDGPDRVHSESFFHECLQREFHRAWRGKTSFAVMALAWKSTGAADPTSLEQISDLVVENVRSADLVARCGSTDLWVLLPATAIHEAGTVAERFINMADERFHGAVALHVGIAGFTQDTTVAGLMTHQARAALERAGLSEKHGIEVHTSQEILE